MKDIVIIGAGGFGREVAWLIERINNVEKEWNLLGFIDDDKKAQGKIVNGYPVLGNVEWLSKQNFNVANAIGDPLVKKKVIENLKGSAVNFPVLIDPSVIYSESVTFGEGAIICAANVITTNIAIGKHVIINLDCTIGHDAILGDYTTVLPSVNISGFVETEECVSIGTGSAVIQGVKIENKAVIGAGAIVVRDIPANCVAVGAPAKPIKFNEVTV